MTKSKLIDENQYFVESKKAIQLVLENEKTLSKKMKIVEKHELVSKHLKQTNNPDEYDKLEKLEKELKRKIQFRQFNEPAIPAEQREKISRNVEIEQSEANEKLTELIEQLSVHYNYIENEVLPILKNIETLERLSVIPGKIDFLLDAGEIGEETVFSIDYLLKMRNHSPYADIALSTMSNLNKAINGMRKLESTTTISQTMGGER